MIQLLMQIILFLGTLISGIVDAKTGYIFNWITHPLIIIGVIFLTINFSLFNLISAILIFLGLYVLYKFGKIGGGDVKLFTAIALLNPFGEINFLITLVFISAISSMIFYSIYYTLKYAKKGIDFNREKEGIFNAMILLVVLIFYFSTMLLLGANPTILFFIIPFSFGLLFIALQKGIKEEFFEEKVTLNKLEDDEILGDKNNKKIFDLLKGKTLIGKKEILLLKKNKIKQIYILTNLPKFGPFIFIGTTFALIYPQFLLIIF